MGEVWDERSIGTTPPAYAGLPFLRHLADGAQPMHELKPSLDGSPLEICLELLLGDHAPGESAALITRVLDPADETARLIANARTNFFQASNLNRMEELEQSLAFIRSAKAKLREAALIWLAPRECSCCRAMRERLQRDGN